MEVHRVADGKPVEVVRRDGRDGVNDRFLVRILDNNEVVEVRDSRAVVSIRHLQRERHQTRSFALSVESWHVLICRIIVVAALIVEALGNAIGLEHVVVRRNRIAVADKRKTCLTVFASHITDRESDGEVVRHAVVRVLAVGEADPTVGIKRRLVRPGVGRVA